MPKVTVQYTRSLVVPSAANITGQILELGNWGKKVNEYLKVIKDKAVDVKGAENSLRLLS
jgi:RES domain-containing protein